LVAYTTVLESQRQAFDAEVTVVQLRNLLLQNRLSLYQALGGEFSTTY
jgi:outer membrane protein TolC